MSHIDLCLETLRRLIAAGDANSIPLAEKAVDDYWAATPLTARKSGLLYIQQMLNEHRDAFSRESRVFADTVDAYVQKIAGSAVDRHPNNGSH
jgi:hypothetical protein